MFYGLGVTWESIDRVVRKTGIAQGCKKTGTYSMGVFVSWVTIVFFDLTLWR